MDGGLNRPRSGAPGLERLVSQGLPGCTPLRGRALGYGSTAPIRGLPALSGSGGASPSQVGDVRVARKEQPPRRGKRGRTYFLYLSHLSAPTVRPLFSFLQCAPGVSVIIPSGSCGNVRARDGAVRWLGARQDGRRAESPPFGGSGS